MHNAKVESIYGKNICMIIVIEEAIKTNKKISTPINNDARIQGRKCQSLRWKKNENEYMLW